MYRALCSIVVIHRFAELILCKMTENYKKNGENRENFLLFFPDSNLFLTKN